MSKRYGRNQKRQHRERIAELETRVRTLEALNEGLSRRATRAEQAISDSVATLRRVLPENSGLLPPKIFDRRGEYADRFFLHHSARPPVSVFDYQSASVKDTMALEIYELERLTFEVEREAENYAEGEPLGGFHAYTVARVGDRIKKAYWFSPNAVAGGLAPHVAREFVEEVARDIGQLCTKNAPAKPGLRRGNEVVEPRSFNYMGLSS